MIRALRSCEQGDVITVKLTKKNQGSELSRRYASPAAAAHLSFTVRSHGLAVEQNVPVVLQTFAHWQVGS